MLTSIRGVYRKGKIELIETPQNLPDETKVIVTFLETLGVDLRDRGINEDQAAELRARLASFAEDWDDPDMDVYDDYEHAKPQL